nr:magnesium-chelatase subunit ChlD, chloroplastic [Ipomoea batatas]
MDEGISNLLLNVLTEGVNIGEREGISFRHPCKPLLIATYNPEEGAVREHLLDRIGINLSEDLPMSFENRFATVDIATQSQERSDEVLKMVDEETYFSKTQGHRAEMYAARVAKFLAALEGHDEANVDDLKKAGHRAELYAAGVAKCLASLEGRDKANVDDLKKVVSYVRVGPVKRLAVDATLRAAAPYQKLCREKGIQKSRKVFVEKMVS